LRMAGAPTAGGARHELERISRARVLSLRLIVEVRDPRLRVERHVFEHRAEAVGRGVDLGLSLRRKLDAFGVAATLKIEDAIRSPAMLIVADEHAVRIG